MIALLLNNGHCIEDFKIWFYVYLWAWVYMCTTSMKVPEELGKEYWIHWGYRWLWATYCGSSAIAISDINLWAISPALWWLFKKTFRNALPHCYMMMASSFPQLFTVRAEKIAHKMLLLLGIHLSPLVRFCTALWSNSLCLAKQSQVLKPLCSWNSGSHNLNDQLPRALSLMYPQPGLVLHGVSFTTMFKDVGKRSWLSIFHRKLKSYFFFFALR